jgi:hypothetical protein
MIGPLGHYDPKTVEDLARESDLVVRAAVSRPDSYLTPDGQRILTDYRIVPGHAVTGPSRAVVPPFVAVYGGQVTTDGVVIRATDANLEPIEEGAEYLLFLKALAPDTTRYEIYHGAIFKLQDERVRPLLKDGDRVFKGLRGSPVSEVIQRIEKARVR